MASYKFTLRDIDGSVTFGSDKVMNWDSIEINQTRNQTYRGLLRKFTGELEFVGSIRKRLIRLVDRIGSEAEIYLTIYVGNDNRDRSSFKLMGDGELKADMTTWEVSELSCKCNFLSSGFEEVLMNRNDNEVEYNTHTSVDGVAIPVFLNETRRIELHDRVLELNSAFDIDSSSVELNGFFVTSYIPVAFIKAYASDDDFKNVPISVFSDKNASESFFILKASESKDINMNYSISTILQIQINAGVWFYKISKRKVDVDYNQISEDVIFDSDFIFGSGLKNISVNYNADLTEHLNVGESLQLLISITQQTPITADPIIFGYYPNKNAIISNSKSYFPASTADCIPPHELFSRFCSIYTGSQMPFYSETFGRTDLGYAQDGEWCWLVALNGLMIRSFPFAGTDENTRYARFASSLKKAFESYNAILNLYATIEFVNGQYRFRIDKYDDLFNQADAIDLGELIAGVSRSLDKNILFGEMIAGYENEEYEELNGLGAFNGQFNFTPPIKSVTTKLSIKSKYRTDDYGIELIRRKPYASFPTEDTNGDDDIFLIDAKISGDHLVAVRDEYFSIVTGILNPTSAYNLRLSPGRNIRRWGSVIHSAMPHGGVIKFMTGAKNTQLVTRLLTETESIVENADIDVATLAPALYLPERLALSECVMSFDKYLQIEANRNSVVFFKNKGVNLYGYIDDLSYDPNKKTAKVELIRANR